MHFNAFSNAVSCDEAEFKEYFWRQTNTPTSLAALNYYPDLGKSACVWTPVTPSPHLTQLKSLFYSIVVEQRPDGKITQKLEFI